MKSKTYSIDPIVWCMYLFLLLCPCGTEGKISTCSSWGRYCFSKSLNPEKIFLQIWYTRYTVVPERLNWSIISSAVERRSALQNALKIVAFFPSVSFHLVKARLHFIGIEFSCSSQSSSSVSWRPNCRKNHLQWRPNSRHAWRVTRSNIIPVKQNCSGH